MREISIDRAVPGMVVGDNVYPPNTSSENPLVAASVTLTEGIRARLLKAGVTSIRIDDALSEGIEAQAPITDEVRRGSLSLVRTAFGELRRTEGSLSAERVEELEATMNQIIAEISGRRNLLVCLNDLRMFGGDRMSHAVNVCVIGCAIGRKYFEEQGWVDYRGQRRQDQIPDRLQKLGIGLLLQDVGSLAIPDEIWGKRGLLKAKERAILQEHPTIGVEMIASGDISPLIKVTIAQHHEKYDGSGYPKGLSGDDIHDNGQLAAIAETFVSLVHGGHGGGPTFTGYDAYQRILQAGGRLFRPTIVRAFTEAICPYAVGDAVQLSDGKYGLVVANTASDTLHPVVRITHDIDGVAYERPYEVDTATTKVDVMGSLGGLPDDGAPVAV